MCKLFIQRQWKNWFSPSTGWLLFSSHPNILRPEQELTVQIGFFNKVHVRHSDVAVFAGTESNQCKVFKKLTANSTSSNLGKKSALKLSNISLFISRLLQIISVFFTLGQNYLSTLAHCFASCHTISSVYCGFTHERSQSLHPPSHTHIHTTAVKITGLEERGERDWQCSSAPCTPRGQRRKCHLNHSPFLHGPSQTAEDKSALLVHSVAEGAPCRRKRQTWPHQEILLLCKLFLERRPKHSSLPVIPRPVLAWKNKVLFLTKGWQQRALNTRSA